MIAETLRTWLLGVIAAGMIVGILYALLPRGRMKAVAHTCLLYTSDAADE